ncbi:MAG: Hsp70 family protein, partial [Clostridiales bacterium]|nr:Hsp70 family protein [Clostridiales bacterium]
MSNTVIGIDLGTATTEAAVVVDGQVKMIPNPEGQFVTPSVVGVDEGGSIIVGERAKAQYLLAPERTAIEVKRSIGTGERISLGRVSYSPVELSAMLLSYVKRYASDYLGEEVSRAVISVPAYFDDLQRQEVVQAGIQAGLTVERIINEPTAAALSYGLEHLEEERCLLVYDLGGGTFDVTLLELFEGVLDVKASAGDNHLGGKDFDESLMGRLQSRFEAESRLRLGEDSYARARLKEAAEGCKIALSTQTEARVQIPMLASRGGIPLGLEETVTRADFEAGIQPLLNRTHAPIRRVLEDAGLDPSELQGILLVGGSTRIPLVSADIQQLLGKAPDTDLDPDFSVAKGAAIQGAILAGTLEPDRRLVMTDVCAYTLGIRTSNGWSSDLMSVIIPRNTTIPTTRQRTFYTSANSQTMAKIEVYQ